MATSAAARLSGPVLSISNYGSASPNRVKLAAARSPAKSVSISSPPASSAAVKSRHSCMCSPTNHTGSFRCSLHKDRKPAPGGVAHSKAASPPSPHPSAVLSTGSSAGYVVGDGSRKLAKRAIAPPTKSQNRRRTLAGESFRPRHSRLSTVSIAGDRPGDNRQ